MNSKLYDEATYKKEKEEGKCSPAQNCLLGSFQSQRCPICPSVENSHCNKYHTFIY